MGKQADKSCWSFDFQCIHEHSVMFSLKDMKERFRQEHFYLFIHLKLSEVGHYVC